MKSKFSYKDFQSFQSFIKLELADKLNNFSNYNKVRYSAQCDH